MKGTETAPKDNKTIVATTEEGKELLRLQEANKNTYEDLILSINTKTKAGEVAFAIIKDARRLTTLMAMLS